MVERYRRLADLMELTGMLRARTNGVCIDEIVEHFEISRRTAERMLGVLRDRFPELEPHLRDGHKYWTISRRGSLTVLELPAELAILHRRVAELEADAISRASATEITPFWHGASPSAEPTVTNRSARAYDSCPVGICQFDKDLRFVHINEWLADLNGMSVADHLGRTVEEILPSDTMDIVESLRSVLESGTPVHGSIIGARADQPGANRIFTHNYYANCAEDGTIIGVSCFIEEITHSNQIEAVPEQSFELNRSMLETVPHGIEYIDLNGRIIFANAALHRLYRCDPDELSGRSVFDFVEEAERDSMRSYLAYLVAEQPSPHPHDGRKVAKDGTILDVRTDWTYRFDSKRQLEGFISVITNRASEARDETAPTTLQSIREDLDTLRGLAQSALRDGDSTVATRERVFRMLRRLQRTTDTALLRQHAKATDTDPHSD